MKKKVKSLLFLIVSALVVFILFNVSQFLKEEELEYVLENHSLAIGELVNIDPGNEAFDMSLEYRYKVDNSTYSRIIEVPPNNRAYYRKYVNKDQKAKKIKFRVLYSNEDHSISLINIDDPIPGLGIEEEMFQEDFTNFR